MRARALVLIGAAALLALGTQANARPAATPLALANKVLALPQRKPCDVNMFTSTFVVGDVRIRAAYPEGQPMEPASGPLLTEEQVRAHLSTFMAGHARKAATLSVFDRADVKAKIAEPNLRAAYAALLGTVGESTMQPLLGDRYTTFRSGGVSVPTAVAQSVPSGSTQQRIIFNRRYDREHFGLLIGIVAHEILHHDGHVNGAEEAINNAITALIHLQVLSRHPELVTGRTELVRQLNDLVGGFLNSRVPGTSAGAIVVPNGPGIFPGSPNRARDYWTHFAGQRKLVPGSQRDLKATPAPDALRGVLRAVLRPGTAIPAPLTFSQPTAKLFGQLNDRSVSPVERLRISVLLGLVSMDDVVKTTKLTRARAVQTFRLGSITPACA